MGSLPRFLLAAIVAASICSGQVSVDARSPCHPSPCNPHASCTIHAGKARCTCSRGYIGNGYNCTLHDACHPSPCNPHATCTIHSGKARCTCSRGYTGNGYNCTLHDPCHPSPCNAHASCTNHGGTARCTCRPGYSGNGHTCTLHDVCHPSRCGPNASCAIKGGKAICTCKPGYHGNGHTCTLTNPCSPNPCGAGASCTNRNGTAKCTCDLGYSGNGHVCNLLADPCASAPCDANASCYDNFGTAQCTCNAGYTGDGRTCTYVDPCTPVPSYYGSACGVNDGLGTCVDLGGGLSQCNCNATAGGSNDGSGTCTDQCNPPCDSTSQDCIWLGTAYLYENQLGQEGYGCWCAAGYNVSTTNPISCVPADPCALEPCDDPDAFCYNDEGEALCTCYYGYTGDGANCMPAGDPTVGLLLPDGSQAPSEYFNQQTFRYQSSSFSGSPSDATWTVPPIVDWRSAGRVPPVISHPGCAASWAAAAAAALDAAQAIATNTGYGGGLAAGSAAIMSVQQLLDCSAGSASCSQGGWPLDALDYVARAAALPGPRLFSTAEYPYVGAAPHTNLCAATVQGSLAVVEKSYEAASFFGALGLILAIQEQPVIGLIEADDPGFISYNGTYVYDDPSCFSHVTVNHAVVIVGYNLVAEPPYLVIQNSWGTSWGAGGFMNLSITGGPGTCGIMSFPVYYPVVQGTNPCNPINPCGSGTCTANPGGGGNDCLCPAGFYSAANSDGSATCILVHVCATLEYNPCGFGTCIDDGEGYYVCICAGGLQLGQASDGSVTCIFDPNFPWNLDGDIHPFLYTTTGLESCYLVATAWGLSLDDFAQQNPTADCSTSALLPPGLPLSLDQTSYEGCNASYSIASPLEDFYGIAMLFGLNGDELQSMNPGVDATKLYPGMQLCVEKSGAGCENGPPCAGPFLEFCTEQYIPGAGDTCQSVSASFNLSITELYNLNPGVYCGQLAPNVATIGGGTATLPSAPLCVQGTYFNFCPDPIKCEDGPHLGCRPYYSHAVGPGESCRSITSGWCYNNPHTFKALNARVACTPGHPYIGQTVCVAQRSYSARFWGS